MHISRWNIVHIHFHHVLVIHLCDLGKYYAPWLSQWITFNHWWRRSQVIRYIKGRDVTLTLIGSSANQKRDRVGFWPMRGGHYYCVIATHLANIWPWWDDGWLLLSVVTKRWAPINWFVLIKWCRGSNLGCLICSLLALVQSDLKVRLVLTLSCNLKKQISQSNLEMYRYLFKF